MAKKQIEYVTGKLIDDKHGEGYAQIELTLQTDAGAITYKSNRCSSIFYALYGGSKYHGKDVVLKLEAARGSNNFYVTDIQFKEEAACNG